MSARDEADGKTVGFANSEEVLVYQAMTTHIVTGNDSNPVVFDSQGLAVNVDELVKRLRRLADDSGHHAYFTEAANALIAQAKELHNWKTWGMIEVAIRNSNVAEFMRHWEQRAETAEARVKEVEESEARNLALYDERSADLICVEAERDIALTEVEAFKSDAITARGEREELRRHADRLHLDLAYLRSVYPNTDPQVVADMAAYRAAFPQGEKP